jgi:flavin-dependent thymidylate synthase
MNQNKVELIGYYGSDESHALSAWTSTSRELTKDKKERIPALLQMLADNGHHTPFEKSTLHFLVRTDLASHIHILKHRISVSANAESARYKELKEPTMYCPDDWPVELVDALQVHYDDSVYLYKKALAKLTPLLGRARAKESARYFLPYANQITMDVSFNWRSFHHFLNLRNKPEAQKEIRDIANTMLELVKGIEGNPFEHTIKALKH